MQTKHELRGTAVILNNDKIVVFHTDNKTFIKWLFRRLVIVN